MGRFTPALIDDDARFNDADGKAFVHMPGMTGVNAARVQKLHLTQLPNPPKLGTARFIRFGFTFRLLRGLWRGVFQAAGEYNASVDYSVISFSGRLTACLLLMTLTSCLPDIRTDLALPDGPFYLEPSAVKTEYKSVPGYHAPGTPPHLNQSFYLRYFADTPTETVLLLVPGIFAGAANFDTLARQLVASRPGLEVWAVDRRANGLEDRTALVQSLKAKDPNIAYRYYVTEQGTPEGFAPVPAEDLPFMRRWGLVTHLWDLHALVKRARQEANTVILGGHSLGASFVSFYPAYTFERGRIGDTFIDGLLLLDGTLGRTGAFGIAQSLVLGNWELLPDAVGFDEGRGPPYLPFGSGPDFYAESDALALLAALAPKERSPASSFPITNLALLGLRTDRDFVASPLFTATVGEPVGATYGGNLLAFLLSGFTSTQSRTVAGVADGFDVVSWSAGNLETEPTDLSTFARSLVLPETDANEWYFPLRLLIDMSALTLNLRDTPNFVPHSRVNAPTLAIGAARGLVTTTDGFSGYGNLRAGSFFSSYVVPGFAHLDLLTARKNPVVPLFNRWLGRVQRLK